ncbi:MAG: hypothetical protein C0434_07140 [Xanthomonadaceae bacterium]|nr:hypothetical protein [Xanthomonadaceae bacterium]
MGSAAAGRQAVKTKPCDCCAQPVTVAYRFQLAPAKGWRFACPACLPAEQAKPGYRYGGTWKGSRH